jgi:TatA/E family protein of Tat protein translocase
MFGLGTWEIILVAVVAILFLGPEKLPELAKKLGKGVRSLQDAMSGVDKEIKPVRQAAQSLNRSIDDMVNLDDDDDAGADPESTEHAGDEEGAAKDNVAPPEEEDDGRIEAGSPFEPQVLHDGEDAEIAREPIESDDDESDRDETPT